MKNRKKTRAKVLAAISVNCIWCMCICIGLHPGPLLSPFFWTSRPHLPAGTFLNTRSLRPFIFFPFRKQSVPLHRRETRQHSSPSFYASIILSFFTRLFSFFLFFELALLLPNPLSYNTTLLDAARNKNFLPIHLCTMKTRAKKFGIFVKCTF